MSLIGTPEIYENWMQPVVFLHMEGKELLEDSSFNNKDEIEIIAKIYRFLTQKYQDRINLKKVGVISPYSGQVGLIRKRLKEEHGNSICPVEVNTVDGFQGREKDIIIFSTVRSFND